MSKYNRTFIYKLICNDSNITSCYVGHTIGFYKRRNDHKYHCTNPNSPKHNYNVYQCIRNNGGWDNWKMIEIELCNCNNHKEAISRERYWIQELHADLNKHVPGQFSELCDGDINKYNKMYRETHKQYFKDYRIAHREYFINYCREYRKKNQDKVSNYSSEYYEKNKHKINEKYTCECGSTICKTSKHRHINSKVHQKYLESIQ